MARAKTPASPDAADSPSFDWAHQAGVVDRVLEKVAQKVQRKRRRRRVAASVAGACAVAWAVFWGVPYVRDTSTVATAAAQRQELALRDGSVVELSAQTSLRTDFRYHRRLVRLEQGEAFFSVAHDTEHPFRVETAAGTVRVTGTKFNVRVGDDGRAVVTLLEGGVAIEDTAVPARLQPGQQASFDRTQSAVRPLAEPELARAVAWRRGVLMLDGLSLAEALARLAAYHGTTIDVAPDAGSLHPGGSIPLSDLSGALGALEEAMPIRVLRRADGSCRVVAR